MNHPFVSQQRAGILLAVHHSVATWNSLKSCLIERLRAPLDKVLTEGNKPSLPRFIGNWGRFFNTGAALGSKKDK
jgi:hypothetical protein